jgi:hypothetical protein
VDRRLTTTAVDQSSGILITSPAPVQTAQVLT